MHPEAFNYVRPYATDKAVSVLDIGGRNVNGSPRELFPHADPYRVLDILPGADVDIVADAASWVPDRRYDIVLCLETFEHAPMWRDIVRTAYSALSDGGLFIATMGGPNRVAHSAHDGGPLWPREYYGNVSAPDLTIILEKVGFEDFSVEYDAENCDTRCLALRPRPPILSILAVTASATVTRARATTED